MNDPARTVPLPDFQERWLAFCWYPTDFTLVCPTELLTLSDRLNEFADLDAAVLAARTDSVFSHRAWLTTPPFQNGIEGLRFLLLSDKSCRNARDWGVLLEESGRTSGRLNSPTEHAEAVEVEINAKK